MLFHTLVYSNSTTMKFWRSRSFGDLGRRSFCDLGRRSHVSCLSTFSNGFSSETTGQISFKSYMQPSSNGDKKVYILRLGHMTKMAALTINGENLKILLLQNHWASCLETWYVTSCIVNNHFGTVTLRLQKISKFISKTNTTL